MAWHASQILLCKHILGEKHSINHKHCLFPWQVVPEFHIKNNVYDVHTMHMLCTVHKIISECFTFARDVPSTWTKAHELHQCTVRYKRSNKDIVDSFMKWLQHCESFNYVHRSGELNFDNNMMYYGHGVIVWAQHSTTSINLNFFKRTMIPKYGD